MTIDTLTLSPVQDEESTPINILQQGAFDWYETTSLGIQFKNGTPQEKWLEAMERLCGAYEASDNVHARLLFMLGDALAYGERAYGDEFAQGIEGTRQRLRLSMKTIENAAIICRNVPEANRHFALTMSHYDAVSALAPDKQAEVLQKAEDEGDSVATLKNRVARLRLTEEDKKQIATQTSEDTENLTAAEISRLLKRAKRGETGTPEPKAIIDLTSEEGILHALDKATERLKSYDYAEMPVPAQKKWSCALVELAEAFSPCRREKFAQALAKIAINYLLFAEGEKPAREWDDDRKEAWKPILSDLQKIYRRSMVSTHGKGEQE